MKPNWEELKAIAERISKLKKDGGWTAEAYATALSDAKEAADGAPVLEFVLNEKDHITEEEPGEDDLPEAAKAISNWLNNTKQASVQ